MRGTVYYDCRLRNMTKKFDAIVIGAGAMGSAALYQLTKKGIKVLGIDQFSPPHIYGSSHGDTRITRQAIGEGEQYTPLALRSYELWREIEKATGRNLLTITGGLIISSEAKTAINHAANFFENTVAAAKKYNIKHDVLDATQIRKRFPQFNVKDDEVGYYEYNAGFLRPEECIKAQLLLAEKYGARIHTNEKVLSFTEENGVAKVTTNIGEYEARQVIVSVGAWIPTFLEEEYAKLFKVIRQVLFWFDIKGDIERFEPNNFPIFIWELQGNKQGIYGFPAIDGKNGGVKIAGEQYETTTTADTINQEVSEKEKRLMYKNIAPYFLDLNSKCIKAAACLYTVTPDFHFIIDRHPKYPSMTLASPCSGHGFKHSAAIGEVLAELATKGESKMDISSFKLSRFN